MRYDQDHISGSNAPSSPADEQRPIPATPTGAA
jgi:hypothetical protein